MAETSLPSAADPARKAMTRRRRDFIVLLSVMAAILTGFWLLGMLRFVEALTAIILSVSLSLAYFAGSSASADPKDESQPAARLAALERARQRAINAIPLPVFELDSESRIISANPAAAMVLHLKPGTSPRASTLIRSPDLLSAIETARTRGADPAIVSEFEAEGQESWRLTISRPADAPTTIVVLEDLTLVRRTQRTRADFIANASHELRTPLTTIAGLVDTLRGPARDDPEARARFLDIMARESARMNRLISDLLSLSRIEASERAAPTATEDFSAIVREAVSLVQTAADAASVSIRIDAPQTPLNVIAYRDELVQVIENLVSNAVKYSRKGGAVSLTFGAAPGLLAAKNSALQVWPEANRMTLQAPAARGVDTGAIWLRVEDQGPGIEPEHLPRLGERFYRADQSRGGEIKGTGLGLAIVKHIMAHHRGGLGVETRPGQGSAFGVWFPAA